MLTVEQLVKAFQELRRDRGITVAKLQNRPDLLAAFKCDNGQAFIDFLEEATISLMDDPKVKAALSALAIGYEPMKDLKTRRLHFAGVADEKFEDKQQNLRRHEDEGFKEIATHLLEVNQTRMDSRNLYDRVDELERALTLLTTVTKHLLQHSTLNPVLKRDLQAKIDKYPYAIKRPLRAGELPIFGDDVYIAMPSSESQPSQD